MTLAPALASVVKAARISPLRKLHLLRTHRGLTPSDVFLASYPKSGNTWLRHLVTALVTGEPTAWRDGLSSISMIVGKHDNVLPSLPNNGRLIKTHESFRNDYGRSIFLVRDPREVVASEFNYQLNFSKHLTRHNTSFDRFVEAFLAGKVNGYGAWHEHTLSWAEHMVDSPNDVLLIRYGDLRTDTFREMRRIRAFLRLDVGDDRLHAAIENSTIERMREKEAEHWAALGEQSRGFVRSGSVARWSEILTGQDLERFDLITACARQAVDLP